MKRDLYEPPKDTGIQPKFGAQKGSDLEFKITEGSAPKDVTKPGPSFGAQNRPLS
jgi:hypothetical protein